MVIPEGMREAGDGAVTRTRNAAVVQFPSDVVSSDETLFFGTLGFFLEEIYGDGFLDRVGEKRNGLRS